MTNSSDDPSVAPRTSHRTEPAALRVAMAAAIGTAVESYDFVLYAFVAAIVFGPLYFSSVDPWMGTVAAIATQAAAFVARPAGSIVFGYIGDRFGRKPALISSLSLMGLASFAVGLLPTRAEIGIWAPALLIALRLIQGFSIGGEWAGAVTMSVEHAPPSKRAFYGSFTQLGNMIGIGLAAATLLLVATVFGDDFLHGGGWRLPFLLSGVLVVIGIVIRTRVDETPDFVAHRSASTLPQSLRVQLGALFSESWRQLIGITLMWASPGAALYIVMTGMLAYTKTYVPELNPVTVQIGLVIGSAVLILVVFSAALVAGRIGRRRMIVAAGAATMIWAIPCILLINTGFGLWVWSAMAVGSVPYAIFSAAAPSYMAELFPVSHRYLGVGLSISLGLIVGGGIIPTVAMWWTGIEGGSPVPLMICLAIAGSLTIAGVSTTRNQPLRVSTSPFPDRGRNEYVQGASQGGASARYSSGRRLR